MSVLIGVMPAAGPSKELPPRYILKVDLLEKEVSEFGEIDENIALEDIDFVKFGPPEGAAPEEADPEQRKGGDSIQGIKSLKYRRRIDRLRPISGTKGRWTARKL